MRERYIPKAPTADARRKREKTARQAASGRNVILAGIAGALLISPATAAASTPELPNIITVLNYVFDGAAWSSFLQAWENVIFSLLIAVLLGVLFRTASRKRERIPRGLQNLLEWYVEAMDTFIGGILGEKEGRKFVPFLGSLFVYILSMNYFGLFPLMKSPTANLNTTVALAISVFCYVQYTGMKRLGKDP